MRRLIPRIVVFPFQRCDGGHVVLRATFRLQLAWLLSDGRTRDALDSLLERVLTVDLFGQSDPEIWRERVVAARADGLKEREVARLLGIKTSTAQRAAALQRKIDEVV